MSEENVDVFRRGADAANRGDAEEFLREVHPDGVFEPLRAATEGAYVGHDGIRRFWADTEETFELFQVDYTDIRDLGDRVLAIGTIRVRGRGSGVETRIPTAAIAEYRDGLLWRYKDYGESRLALEVAGLSE
jgi:ketosteroid isomerase-like protein